MNAENCQLPIVYGVLRSCNHAYSGNEINNIIVSECAIPEKINTPATEGIVQRTPLLWNFQMKNTAFVWEKASLTLENQVD